MLSFNCADLILVTYLVTENTVYHSPSPQEYSLFQGCGGTQMHIVRMDLWFSLFVCVYMCRNIVSRLSDSTQLPKHHFGGTECACSCGGGLMQQ